ncbi:hypothetical protein LTR94_033592 [Friedmanniomyces endolithicus]|nr:hypothetical protein LTR94_033592 [Friedmanniomyces endolithicus]
MVISVPDRVGVERAVVPVADLVRNLRAEALQDGGLEQEVDGIVAQSAQHLIGQETPQMSTPGDQLGEREGVRLAL